MEINGIEYEEIPRQVKSGRMSKMMLAAFGSSMDFAQDGAKASNPLSGINVVEEFKLIQEKKSNKSKRVRDAVVFAFNRTYRPVTNNQS